MRQRLALAAKVIAVAAGGWAVVATLVVAFGSWGQGVRLVQRADGTQVRELFTTTFFETQEWWGLFVLLVAASLGIGGGWAAWTGRIRLLWVLTVIFLIGCLLAGFSIGPFYFPAAVGLLLAALLVSSVKLLRSES